MYVYISNMYVKRVYEFYQVVSPKTRSRISIVARTNKLHLLSYF